jgi:serine/threonine-protein kinase
MTIGPGTRVGPYEITALIGEGGMGKVWRAHHTALKRDDALKVLPDAFASDPDRLARFRREAQVLASLNHPNIAHVYGLEQADGVQALVMELVEGPTLADRIAQGPIPVDEALPIAKQIAEALEAAHEQGIIHRDLKPANIKLRPDGTVKVLDFGLAKALEPAAAHNVDATASPTITSPPMMTGVGMLLGAAAYMSPEQARGKPVDKRSDIWAFGCVLYEMVTGRRAFEGDDVSDTLAAVLRGDPDWAVLPSAAGWLTPVLRTCLQKSVRHRMKDMGDVRLALDGAFTLVAPSVPPAPGWRRVLALVGVAGTILVIGGFAGVRLFMDNPAIPITRLELPIPAEHQVYTGGGGEFALSPDGRSIAYIGLLPTRERQLFRRNLDQLTPVFMSGLGDVSHPAWSPDSTWLSYRVAGSRLLKINAAGGSPITLVEEQPGACFGATWLDNETLVFCGREGTTERLYRIPANGGSPMPLTNPPAGVSHRYPQALPGSGLVFFTAWYGSVSNAKVAVVSTSTGEEREILSGTNPRLLSTGHLVFFREDGLWAVPFDQHRLSASGEPRRVIENVQVNNGGLALFAASSAGLAGYVTGTDIRQQRRLVWVDRTGNEEPVDAPPRFYGAPRIA